MKSNLLRIILLLGLALLCGCTANHPTNSPQQTEIEPGGEPMDITAFSFQHGASLADECYLFKLTKDGDSVRLYAEELFSGGRIVDTMIEDDVLDQLGELMGTYHVDRWDGFDKNNKHVMDGSSFTLSVTLADGSTISAHGSNAFPDNYSEVSDAIRTMYETFTEQYALNDGTQDPLDGAHTESLDPDAPKTIASTEIIALSARFFCPDVDNPSQGSHYAFQILPDDNGGWILSSSAPTENRSSVDQSVLQEVQSLISTYDLASFNGLYSVTAGLPPEFSPASLSVDYASGEHLEFTVDGDPDFLWCAAFKELLLNILSLEGADES